MESLSYPLPASEPTVSRARWGRAAMASFFVVGAALSTVAQAPSWSRVLAGGASTLDWLYVVGALAGIVSGVLFALGRATAVIAQAWIGYCIVRAVGAYPFWAVPAAEIAEHAMGFMSHLAVAGSLMLYVAHRDANG